MLSVNLRDGVVVRGAGLDDRPAPSEDRGAYLVVEPGALVMNPLGKPHGSLGVSEHAGIVSPAYLVAAIDKVVYPRFLHYLLRTRLYISEYERRGKWMPPSQFNISWDQLKLIRVALPRYPAQRTIADFLNGECARIAELIAESYAIDGVLDEAERRAIDDCLDGHAPILRLSWLADVRTGLTLGQRFGDQAVVEYPYLRVANVQAGRVDLEEVKTVALPAAEAKATTLVAGDVLMTEGGDIDKLGRGTVWNDEIPGCLHQNHVFAVRTRDELEPRYLALVTRSSLARRYFEMTATRSTNLASTNSSKVRAFRFPVPALAEQARIVSEVTALLQTLRVSRQELMAMRQGLVQYRDALITEAVTGKLDISRLVGKQMGESGSAARRASRPGVSFA